MLMLAFQSFTGIKSTYYNGFKFTLLSFGKTKELFIFIFFNVRLCKFIYTNE